MNRSILFVATLVVGLGLSAWGFFSFRAYKSYETARSHLAEGLLSAADMDTVTESYLAEIRSGWTQRDSRLNGAHADALRTVALNPTVANLVQLLTYRIPNYSLTSMRKNEMWARFAATQVDLPPLNESDRQS